MNKQNSKRQNKIKSAPTIFLYTNNWIKWLLAGLILLITYIVFAPVLNNDFINFDDPIYVTYNKDLAKPIWEGIKYFFGQHYYAGNYTPFTMIIYALEYHSVKLNPELYHLVNLIFHLINVFLTFWFIYFLSEKKIEVAAFVSFFFGIHPMHVESVAFISELKDVLYACFFIGGLLTYTIYVKTLSTSNNKHLKFLLLLFTFLLFIFSSLSKPAAVVFPVVLLLIDFYKHRKFYKILWIEKIPFFLVSIIIGLITLIAPEQVHFINKSYTLIQSLMFASYSLLVYILKLFLPINLSTLYPYPQAVNGHLPYFFYLAPFIVTLLLAGIYIIYKASDTNTSASTQRILKTNNLRHSTIFGFLFFLINIALVLKALPIGPTIMSDRYTYIPYIGLFFIIAIVISFLFKNRSSKVKAIIVFILIIVAGLFLTSAYTRCQVWQNSETVWDDALNNYPDDISALNNKGALLVKKNDYRNAMKLFERAIYLKPNNGISYINLAVCNNNLHDYDNALKNLDIELKIAPANTKALNMKGNILLDKAKYKEAIELYKTAIKYNAYFADSYINLSYSYILLSEFKNALLNIDKGLQLDPQNPIAHFYKGLILFNFGEYNEAINNYNEAINLNPQFVDAYKNVGFCYVRLKDYDKAIYYWKKALEIDPNNAGIYKMLGLVYRLKGDLNSAQECSAKADELKKHRNKLN